MVKKEKRKASDASSKSFGLSHFFMRNNAKFTGLFSGLRLNLLRKIKIQWRLIAVFLLLTIGPLLALGISSYNLNSHRRYNYAGGLMPIRL